MHCAAKHCLGKPCLCKVAPNAWQRSCEVTVLEFQGLQLQYIRFGLERSARLHKPDIE